MLDKIIIQMIHNIKFSHRGQYRKLKNGLTIELFPLSNSYILMLSREDVYPSDTEWQTVINNFPYSIGVTSFERQERWGKYNLIGNIPKESH